MPPNTEMKVSLGLGREHLERKVSSVLFWDMAFCGLGERKGHPLLKNFFL